MDLSDPETWRWIWLVLAVAFAAGEITVAGSFFLAPFAIGAAVAALLGFVGVDVGPQWIAFVAVSGGLLAAMRPLAHRLDQSDHVPGVGSSRQVGQQAIVIEDIEGPHGSGFVKLGAERWRAESADGTPLPSGTTVVVTEVRGTRVIVAAAATPAPADPSDPIL